MINMDDEGGGLVSKEQNGEQYASFTRLEGLLIAETVVSNCAETGAIIIELKDVMAANDASETKLPVSAVVVADSVIGSSPADDENRSTEVKLDPLACQSSPEAEASTPGSQKKGLRVSFPEDKVVSGYMDPPTPWNDAAQCSTDELVAAYLSACEKLGVKPNARLLSQLQVITNFDDRNETLTLKNENLDAKHCETLEEVFRRVQFRTVDLEATKLEEEGAVTIFDMIEYYESCLKLNISYSKNLGQRGWQACSRMIRKTPCLENLEARGSSLSDFVMPFLGRSLRVGSALTSLHLEFTVTSGKPLQILVAALKVNETLKELYLADNKLMPSDGIQLGSLLKYNRTLHLLDLRNNHLQDTGFLHICEGVWEQGKSSGLNTLVIWNNQLSYQAMNHLSRALLNSISLETLNLGHNNLTNEGMHRLKESLLKNKSLLRIGLQASKITCEGAVALAEFIAESTSLVRLDLRENEIKTGGLMALCLALKVSQSVTRIDLDKDPKKESGVKDYADQQKRLLVDISNYMQRNRTLARQREEDEIAQETDCNNPSQSPPTTTTTTPDSTTSDKTTPVTATNPQPGEAEKEPGEEEPEKTDKIEEEAEFVEEWKGPENSPRHRMSLTLQLKTRCQMLESPDFVPESEMSAASPPPSEESSSAMSGSGVRRKIPMDIPPSPMVSSQGRTVLVPVFDDPLSPSLDDMAPLTGKTCPSRPHGVVSDVDADCVSSQAVGDCRASTPKSDSADPDGFAAASPNLEGFSSAPSSPDGSYLSPEPDQGSSFRPILARSASLPADVPPGRSPHRKSTLKATRPKHRFQVSKTVLPHKPPLGRRVSGSHKMPVGVDGPRHSRSEHSTVESTSSAFASMLPLTTFQLKAPADNVSLKTIEASCDNASAPASSPAIDEPNLPITGGQNTSDIDSLQATTPFAPKIPLDDASTTPVLPHSSANGVPPDLTQAPSVATEAGAESSAPGEHLVDTVIDHTTIPNTNTEATSDDFETSGILDGEQLEKPEEIPGIDAQNFPSLSSERDDTETCKTRRGEANGSADDGETNETNDISSGDKTSRVCNGIRLEFPQDVIDLDDPLSDDVRKLHLGNTTGSSGDHFDAKKSIV